MSSSIVELNGKRYDAVTGVFLGNTKHQPQSNRMSGFRGHQGRSIDGFATKSKALAAPVTKAKPNKAHNIQKSAVHSIDGFAHSSGNSLVPHQPERSRTLMRGAVKTPHLDLKPAIKTQLPAERQAAVLHPIAPKLSATQVNPNRLAHSKQVARSHHVNHFTAAAATAPAAPVRPTDAPRKRPVAKPEVIEQSEEDMFESAIAQATSHEQKAPKRRMSWKRKLGNTAAAVVALVVIGIFVAYLNLPTIELNIASMQAGFHASIPNYKALGFAMNGPVKAVSGKIAMNFTSGDSQFTLTQQSSNWDNQTLMETLASQTDSVPKTIQANGRTIYMVRTNQATWVNGGIRYDLTGNANLNNQEITSVADSM